MRQPHPLQLDNRRLAGLNLPPVKPPSPPAPVLNPWTGSQTPERPYPGESTMIGCGAQRMHLAGGALNSLLVNPEVVPFERLYRRLPEEGMFLDTVSPEKPFVFELGAFRAPDTFCLALFDLRPDIYRFSGIDAGDTVPVEARRFSSILGFQTTVDQAQPGNIQFQLNPAPIQQFSQAFTDPLPAFGEGSSAAALIGAVQGSRFNIGKSSGFADASGAGLALQPQRPTRYGPLDAPFVLYVRSAQTFQVRCAIFRPIPSPIAFIEYDIAGFLIPETYLQSMLDCMKPLANASFGPGSWGVGPR